MAKWKMNGTEKNVIGVSGVWIRNNIVSHEASWWI